MTRTILALGGMLLLAACGGSGTTGTNYSDPPPIAEIVATPSPTPTPSASPSPVDEATDNSADAVSDNQADAGTELEDDAVDAAGAADGIGTP
ncbi:hypothetical protein DMC47_02635 [Nostoc sp. 3335mG]|nr:hypothetical protein DMC47_02635 [Nostoc sp. 3335mG]